MLYKTSALLAEPVAVLPTVVGGFTLVTPAAGPYAGSA